MKTFKYLIIEDELSPFNNIKAIMSNHEHWEIINNQRIIGRNQVFDLVEASKLLEQSAPDLVFLDVSLGSDNGLKLLDLFHERKFWIIIFTAGEHEKEAWDIKRRIKMPVEFIRKGGHTSKAIYHIISKLEEAYNANSILIKALNGEQLVVFPPNIIMFEKNGYAVKMFLVDKSYPIPTNLSIKDLDESSYLPSEFQKINQNCIINISFIEKLRSNKVKLKFINEKKSITRTYRKGFNNFFNAWGQ